MDAARWEVAGTVPDSGVGLRREAMCAESNHIPGYMQAREHGSGFMIRDSGYGPVLGIVG